MAIANRTRAEHNAQCDKSNFASGSSRMAEPYDRILRTKPTTLEGYRAFALAIVENCCWANEIALGGAAPDRRSMAVIMWSLAGVPIEADPTV